MSYLVSAVLLILATVSAATGLVSDLWDLNEFVIHKYTGFVLIFIGLAHVYLHWRRLVSFIRWRMRGRPGGRRSLTNITKDSSTQREKINNDIEDKSKAPLDMSAVGRRVPLSRRNFISFMLGGVGGLALGRVLRADPALPFGSDVGEIYHEWSKPKIMSLLGTVADWGNRPPLYKEYPSAERISLPPPGDFRGLYTEEAIQGRRSVRDYTNRLMSMEELSRLLFYTGGINTERLGSKLRAAPSAGALYPIEIYLVIHRVEALEGGLYHYAVKDHALERLQEGDLRGEIVRHGLMQEFLGQGNLVFVFTAVFQRLRWKYQERTYRYALLEVGHLGQNVYLEAKSMGFGACAVGAFLDDGLNAMLGVDGQEEAALYLLSVGKL
jgi:SagB-type dehydrogenase family enzyme